MDYKIMQSQSFEKLVLNVKISLNQGWKIIEGAKYLEGKGNKPEVFYQTMVKDD
jgi:hypothetical protein